MGSDGGGGDKIKISLLGSFCTGAYLSSDFSNHLFILYSVLISTAAVVGAKLFVVVQIDTQQLKDSQFFFLLPKCVMLRTSPVDSHQCRREAQYLRGRIFLPTEL